MINPFTVDQLVRTRLASILKNASEGEEELAITEVALLAMYLADVIVGLHSAMLIMKEVDPESYGDMYDDTEELGEGLAEYLEGFNKLLTEKYGESVPIHPGHVVGRAES